MLFIKSLNWAKGDAEIGVVLVRSEVACGEKTSTIMEEGMVNLITDKRFTVEGLAFGTERLLNFE